MAVNQYCFAARISKINFSSHLIPHSIASCLDACIFFRATSDGDKGAGLFMVMFCTTSPLRSLCAWFDAALAVPTVAVALTSDAAALRDDTCFSTSVILPLIPSASPSPIFSPNPIIRRDGDLIPKKPVTPSLIPRPTSFVASQTELAAFVIPFLRPSMMSLPVSAILDPKPLSQPMISFHVSLLDVPISDIFPFISVYFSPKALPALSLISLNLFDKSVRSEERRVGK